MSAYRNFVLTNSGIDLLNDILKGDGELEFRYISIGSGIYEDNDKKTEAIRKMSCLKEERQKVGFSNVIKHDKTVELKAHITNQGVTEEYLMTELGIYASIKGAETEILYCVSIREGAPDVMPDFSIGRIHDVIFKVQVSIGDISNVSINYKTDVYALAEDLANHVTDKDNPHNVTKMQVGLSNVDDTADVDKPVSAPQQAVMNALKELLETAIDNHIKDMDDPHNTTKEQVGLGNADDTADIDKPVSRAQQAALDALYQQLTAYTQAKIAELINGAPTSMDTLKEVSDAIAAHKSIMDALDAAIGKKANQAEMDSLLATKLDKTGDASNVTAAFTKATTRANLTTGEKLSVSLGKIMKWFSDFVNGAASSLLGANLTSSRALVSSWGGKVAVSDVTATELGYLSGLTSNIQTKLNELNSGLTGKADSSHTHDNQYYTESEIDAMLKAIPLQTYVSRVNIVPAALNTEYTYTNPNMKWRNCIVAIFYSSVGNVLVTSYAASRGILNAKADDQYWGGEIIVEYIASTGTIKFTVKWIGSSQLLSNFALTDILY